MLQPPQFTVSNPETTQQPTLQIIPATLEISNQQYNIDTAPEKWWSLGVLSPEGGQCLREVVAHVKMMCAVGFVYQILSSGTDDKPHTTTKNGGSLRS